MSYKITACILCIIYKSFSKNPIDLNSACRKGKLDQISTSKINLKILNQKGKEKIASCNLRIFSLGDM